MTQKDIFLAGEARAWLERNRAQLGKDDAVSQAIEHAGIVPTVVLEVGCANGWRLEKLRAKYGCMTGGVDPVLQIGGSGKYINAYNGTADVLPFSNDDFDLVIFGFCLYLIDRVDLFRVASEADRVLQDKGHLIIHDFAASDDAHSKPYAHADGVLSYHQYYPNLWLANPAYRYAFESFSGGEHVTVLKKDIHRGWPLR